MVQDIYKFLKSKNGNITFRKIAKRFPKASKETILLAISYWLNDKGYGPADTFKFLIGLDDWIINNEEKIWRGKKFRHRL